MAGPTDKIDQEGDRKDRFDRYDGCAHGIPLGDSGDAN